MQGDNALPGPDPRRKPAPQRLFKLEVACVDCRQRLTIAMELKCAVQKYDWGKIGSESLVAQLAQSNNAEFQLEETTPYSELWMGTHPNGPSLIKDSSSGETLSELIDSFPDCLGSSLRSFGRDLPFLFKVLSIRKALSIQAHPNKRHAERLHLARPDLYKDSNHKPELAIALTPFEALCGFRPICKIKQYLITIPELSAVIGKEASSGLLSSDEAGQQNALRKCFRALMTCPKPVVESQLAALITRLGTLDESHRALLEASLVERLYSDFPGDVGCFNVYMLNVLRLQPGEALYLGPNEPHAYLSGDCIECMACSDNVVRAGLTPKYQDVDTLCGMLTYISEPAVCKRFEPEGEDYYTKIFRPPIQDFAVAVIVVPGGIRDYRPIIRTAASIFIVTKGDATTDKFPLKIGSVVFLFARQSLFLNVGPDGIVIYQAMVNTI